jgi:hypothetical protein
MGRLDMVTSMVAKKVAKEITRPSKDPVLSSTSGEQAGEVLRVLPRSVPLGGAQKAQGALLLVQ